MLDVLCVLHVPLKAGKGNNKLKYAPKILETNEQFSKTLKCSGD
jgi:hypothetical protein